MLVCPRVSENRAHGVRCAEAENLNWMNEWRKHFGLHTLRRSRKKFSDALALSIVYNCTFIMYMIVYTCTLNILNTHRRVIPPKVQPPDHNKVRRRRCIYIVYACMYIVYNCTFTMYMIVHTLNILNTDRRVTIPPNVLSPNIPQNTQMYS